MINLLNLSENDLQSLIVKTSKDLAEAKAKLTLAKKAVVKAEDVVITHRINLDRYSERLVTVKAANIIQPLEIRELDIIAFRERLPEVMKKLDEMDTLKKEKE